MPSLCCKRRLKAVVCQFRNRYRKFESTFLRQRVLGETILQRNRSNWRVYGRFELAEWTGEGLSDSSARPVHWRRPSARRLFLDSGLSHNIRNVINGRTPDVVVAFLPY